MSSHGRSGSHGSGWFSGTMEVISGMAPRPSTPQPHAGGRPMSAPNSPARSAFSAGINRLPSQDSLDRSIHNESGHGKSTAQIVRDLKHSNSALMAKQATMEAQFMNELSGVTKTFEEQKKQMEDDMKKLKKQVATVEAQKAASDIKLIERDEVLSKERHESAYQRHTISELKNELYQYQGEKEEQDMDKGEDMKRLLQDNQDMAQDLMRMQQDLAHMATSRDTLEQQLAGDQPADSYYQQWKDTKLELEKHQQKLGATEETLTGLRSEQQNQEGAHTMKLTQLQDQLDQQTSAWKDTEKSLLSQIENMEFADNQTASDLRQVLSDRDESILQQQETLDQYADKAAELAAMLEQSRKDASNQEQYRRDEAEDLRILHDAQEEEITKLRKELEDVVREVELRDEQLAEANNQTRAARSLSRDVDAPGDEKSETATMTELSESRRMVDLLNRQIEDLKLDKETQTLSLQKTIDQLSKESTSSDTKIVQRGSQNDSEEFSLLKDHWEKKERNVSEIESLKKEIAIHEQRVQDSADAQKSANERIQELENRLSEKESSKNHAYVNEQKIVQLQKELEAGHDLNTNSAKKLAEANKEIQRLVGAIENTSKTDVDKLKETKSALEKLGDEKREIEVEHGKRIALVEGEKKAAQDESRKEMAATRKKLDVAEARISVLEIDNSNLESNLRSVKKTASDNAGSVKSRDIQIPSDSAATRAIEEERDSLKLRLKDRDMTISTLVKSSMSLESKIAVMENEIKSVQSSTFEEKKFSDTEVDDLRRQVAQLKEREPQVSDDIGALKKQLLKAKNDSKRWRQALQDDGSNEAEHRFQIALLQKELDDKLEKVQERDQAIENLVHQSMSQEAHVKDLKNRLSSMMKESENVRSQKVQHEDSTLKAEVRRLQEESEMFAGQVIVQDEELQELQQNLQLRTEETSRLQQQLIELQSADFGGTRSAKITREHGNLENELNTLRSQMKARDLQISNLQDGARKLGDGPRSSSKKMLELQAELDEMQEASEENRTELRDLRRQLWQAKEAAGEAGDLKNELSQAKFALEKLKQTSSTSSQLIQVQDRLDKVLTEKEALAKQVASQGNQNAVVELQAQLKERDFRISQIEKNSSSQSEVAIETFQKEIEVLRSELSSSTSAVEKLQNEAKEKDSALERSEGLKLKLVGQLADTKDALKMTETKSATSRGLATDEEKDQLRVEKEELTKSKDSLTAELDALKAEAGRSTSLLAANQELTDKLDQAGRARETSEKSIVETYEKQLGAVTKDRDSTIDELRKELIVMREQGSDSNAQMSGQLSELQTENNGLREQFEVELQAKNQQIYALEHTLHAQEQIVESMRAEMDQLQSGMEHANQTRRGEVEDLQQEVMQLESRAMKQDREMTALKMQLEESKLEHRTEVLRLKDTMASMEKESPLAKEVAELQNDDRMLEVRERLEQLKARNAALQEENLKLGGRLERSVIEIKSFELEKQHNNQMESDNVALRSQIKELESILGKAKRSSSSAAPSRKLVDKENPPRLQSSSKSGSKTKSTKKGGLKGLFKRKGAETIQEEEA